MSTVLPPSVANCPLFRLPPELRNQIYAYSVRIEPRFILRDWGKTYMRNLPAIYCGRYSASAPALLTVCRIIHSEAVAEFRSLPQYSIIIVVELGNPTATSHWDRKIRDLFSQYYIKHDIVNRESEVSVQEQWAKLTEWLCDAQEALLSGKTHPFRGPSIWNRGERFEYFIAKREVNNTSEQKVVT